MPGGYSHGPGPGPERPQTSDEGPALKTTRSHKAAAGGPPDSEWLTGASPSL